ncbi:MAG: GNAT family N-acetyltransferase, partial [Clostridium sp.]
CIYEDCDNKDVNAKHLFAVRNNGIIAYLRILNKGVSYEEVSIGRVLTNKNNRGIGLGKKCMLMAINYIKNTMKENKVRISAQEYAVPFYEGVGFEIDSEVYLEDDIPHVAMILAEIK